MRELETVNNWGERYVKIRDKIENALTTLHDEKASELWRVCREIVEAVIPHNKCIIAQMSDYDMHDDTHSQKVLEIIEGLLDDKLEGLTLYELVMIYMAAYLHDSAMAMPKWEYEVLRAVEGTDELYENTLVFHICNDFKPVHKFSEALKIVKENKEKLLDYDTAKEYVFIQQSEEKTLDFLAKLICEYEEFRNGYIESLRQYTDSFSDYYNMSKMIRSEYIRQTHHIRVAENICALKRRFSAALGDRCAQYFTEDLSNICRCHGEAVRALSELEIERKDWTGAVSNIQFVAMLLRLGDVIHFSADRAPLSLFAEKQITDETSFMHWKAKFQELTYEIYRENGNVSIKYMAYCKEPDAYYFIQDYLDGVDREIDNYYSLKNRWDVSGREVIAPYQLPLEMAVNRQEIEYDADCFQPDKGLKFVINQAKILDLLTGIQLYKDAYLCLREVYQNALDASKCMLSYNKKRNITQELAIEFGIGRECIHGVERKYIYCLDHGTGMNEYIIKNCLLHIGNSYYKSREFARKNADWAFGVKPTSQFGIGILSGYMLADTIGITTVYYEEPDKCLSFVMEGASEHFYYTKTSLLDKELLGEHGTLVKLYLKPAFEKNANVRYFEKMPLALMSNGEEIKERVCDTDTLYGNLFYVLSRQIGIETPHIRVFIKDENGSARGIYQCVSVFDARNYDGISDADTEALWSQYYFLDGSQNLYKEYDARRSMIADYVIKVADENMEIYSCLALPRKGIGDVNIKLFDFCYFLGDRTAYVYVDGVRVDERINAFSEVGSVLGTDILEHSILNYYGQKRPSLSVDRNSIVEWPDMAEELEKLRELFIAEVVRTVIKHLQAESIGSESIELSLIFRILSRRFSYLTSQIIYSIKDTEYSKVKIDVLSLGNKELSIQDLFNERTLLIKDANFWKCQEVGRQILFGRMINAENVSVDMDSVTVLGGIYTKFPYSKHVFDEGRISMYSVVIKADEWSGKYAEYDLVNSLWPIVPPKLFEQLQEENGIEQITERGKTINQIGNGLCGIAALDPVLIHPTIGISTRRRGRYQRLDCYVGEFQEIQRDYWLYELSDSGRLVREKKIGPALFAFIAPRKLNKQEETRLAELEAQEEYVLYAKGVREGWSILFLGVIGKYIIVPGTISREEIVQKIPASYKEIKPDLRYVFPDGTSVF